MTRQPVVRRNNYSSLTPPVLGEWQPTKSVSVVMPAFQCHRLLPYVLAGLAAQSYPSHLLEVVIADDQSTPPLELPEVRPENTRIVRVEEGWGRANALAVGAEVAEGDIFHWYDSDMLAYREEVEAHARWHHLIDYAVPLGDKRFVSPDWLVEFDPAVIRDRVAAGEAGDFFPGIDYDNHDWVEQVWEKTENLAKAGPLAHRVHTGATGSVSRALYEDSIGYDRELRLGEDITVGREFAQVGGVFIVEREAKSWHLGRSQVQHRAHLVNRYNNPAYANQVPSLRQKRRKSGRAYEVPYLEVVLPSGPADETIDCVDALLASDFGDLRVVVVGDWDRLSDQRQQPVEDPELELRLVHRSYRDEPRVRLVSAEPPLLGAGGCDAEFRLTLPHATLAPHADAISELTADLQRTHDGERILRYPDGSTARLIRIAAAARAARVADPLDNDAELMEQLFGTSEYEALRVGFVPSAEVENRRFHLPTRRPMRRDVSRQKMKYQ